VSCSIYQSLEEGEGIFCTVLHVTVLRVFFVNTNTWTLFILTTHSFGFQTAAFFYFTQNSHNTCLHPFYFLVPVTQSTRKTFSLRRTYCRTFKSLTNYEKCILSVLSPSVRIKLYGVYTLFAVSFYQFCPEINEQCVE